MESSDDATAGCFDLRRDVSRFGRSRSIWRDKGRSEAEAAEAARIQAAFTT
jgi:hypothetical protein